jgi:hypothetical protein
VLPPELTFHALRHSYASLCVAAGIGADKLSRRLGHAKITTTLDIYTHLFPDDDASGDMAALEAMSAPVSAPNVVPLLCAAETSGAWHGPIAVPSQVVREATRPRSSVSCVLVCLDVKGPGPSAHGPGVAASQDSIHLHLDVVSARAYRDSVAAVVPSRLDYGAAPLLAVDEDSRLASSATWWVAVGGERNEQRPRSRNR